MFNVSELEEIGIKTRKDVSYNLTASQLEEKALLRCEGRRAASGAIVVDTGKCKGRSPKDRYIVRDAETENKVDWGVFNQSTTPEKYEYLYKRIAEFLKEKELYVFDAFSGTDKKYRIPVRVITTRAWHSLFVETLFASPEDEDLTDFKPEFTVINASKDLLLIPDQDGFDSEVAVVINFSKKVILIAGTSYGGEMKKGIFSVMNYLMPGRGVFPMHCSTNVGSSGDVALFFGLSGTGKTTLSADPERRLIGDDQHGWSDEGVFNFEGGCYAKCINLSKNDEPQIYNAIKYGSILENVIMDRVTGEIDYTDCRLTENTRATYPVEHIENCLQQGVCGHPNNIFFLTCDAFGVLPPIARLTPEMAMYHFLSGYTAKVQGTEVGIKEPVATFSAGFGAPFLPLHPYVYAKQLGEKLKKHKTNCWLVNTGWSGGAYGVGSRMKISLTRALLYAALKGELDNAEYTPHSIFNVLMPDRCPGVPAESLRASNTWKDKDAYRATAKKLGELFIENFKKFEGTVSREVLGAGPTVSP